MDRHIKHTYCGTGEYMAPEVYLGEQQTNKVDVWAVGVLLYELFHNRPPFRKLGLNNIIRSLNERRVSFGRGIPPEIEELFY